MSSAAVPSRLQISVERYLKMAAAGVVTQEDRVELIDGDIFNMPPPGTRHSAITGRLVKSFVLSVGDTAILLPGPTLPLGAYSAPEPDLVLLKPCQDFYSHSHPLPSDVLLVIEYLNPTDDGYSDVVSFTDGDVVAPQTLPQVTVPIDTLFT